MSETEQLMFLVNAGLLTAGSGLAFTFHNDPTPGRGLSTLYLSRLEAFLHDALFFSMGAVLSFHCPI